jgi:molybdate transport system substrate-binding protein
MNPGSLVRFLSVIGVVTLAISGTALAADVRVMISAGFHSVYSELAPAFERASGHHLVTTRGPSMGDSPESIPARLARGEGADVVILDGGAADKLGSSGLLRAGSKVELARSLVGMVVRAGAAKPDIGSVDAFRNTLLAAKSIAYSDSGSGTYLSTKLFAQLGVAEQIAGKSRRVRGPPAGEPVAKVVAGRGGDRLPAGQRTDPCRRRDLRRHDSGGAATWFLIRGRAHQYGAAARGG